MQFDNYFKDYNKSIFDLLNNFDTSLIDQSVSLINSCKKNGGKIYIVGNGGSSSIASHVSVDFVKAANIQSETFNNANLITCFANDYGHENWMKEAIKKYCDKGDLVILISSSGNSKNHVVAGNYCKVKGIELITFTGFNGKNKLAKLGKINFSLNSKNYNQIEMVHHIWLLLACDYITKTKF